MKRAIIIGVLTLSACKGHQAVLTNAETQVNTEAVRPAWVQSRPMSDANYIGIGLCPKSRPDFAESAKKSALNDLASEISVKVEGNSLLYTIDRKNSFDESYTSNINAKTSEQLEGFELVDSWENASEYWIYYRLNKAEYARIKAERKQKAIAQATDLYSRAQQSIATGDLKNAFDQDLRGLIAMKDYWGESDLVTIGEKQVPLANEIFGDLQTLTSSVRFSSLPERCELSYANRFKREMLISAAFADGKKVRDLSQLPLTISYAALGGKVTESKNTDTEGHARTSIQRVDPDQPSTELLVRLDVDALVSKDLDAAFTAPLMRSLTIPELHVPIDRALPKVFIQATESNLGQPVTDAGLALGLKEDLTTKGFRFVDRASDADLEMMVNSTTREGGEANGFFTAYLDVSLSFRDRRSGDVIYEGGKQSVKGVQLNYAKAGMAAYAKASQDVRNELVDGMMNALL